MAVIVGTNNAEALTGTETDDRIDGLNGNDTLYGLGGNDTLNGGDGDDVIDGGPGADSMDGGGGSDTFYVDNALDIVNNTDGGVADTVITSVSYALMESSRIRNLTATAGVAPINLSGTDLAEVITGNAGNNRIDAGRPVTTGRDSLYGLAGDDTYIVYGSNNYVLEAPGEGTDTVLVAFNTASATQEYYLIDGRQVMPNISEVEVLAMADPAATFASLLNGNGTSQTLIGNAGNNTLNGGGGSDTLIGLAGDDVYQVDSSSTMIREDANGGSDTVLMLGGGTFVLNAGASVEALTLASTTLSGNLTGNEFSQRITGNDLANVINGGGGSDTMVGLGGNDTYLVRGAGDIVIEANGGGADLVYTTVSYNLGVNEVEALSTVQQTDTSNINLIGNFASQTIVGNYGNNILNGGSGADTLIGLFGNDTYAVGDSRIVIQEQAGQGLDTVVTSVNFALGAGISIEQLVVQDRNNTVAYTLTGNDVAQTIGGASGNDTINGGSGADTLIGFAGADTFIFATALGNGNIDTLADFAAGTDRIGLSGAIFAIGASLDANEFVTGSAATAADQRIVYNGATGQLFYDADGSGSASAILFAQVVPGTALSVPDFIVVAPATA